MIKLKEIPTFACKSCGNPYQAFPPESGLSNAFKKKCKENHNTKQDYTCDICNKVNTLYWCPGHFEIVGGPIV